MSEKYRWFVIVAMALEAGIIWFQAIEIRALRHRNYLWSLFEKDGRYGN